MGIIGNTGDYWKLAMGIGLSKRIIGDYWKLPMVITTKQYNGIGSGPGLFFMVRRLKSRADFSILYSICNKNNKTFHLVFLTIVIEHGDL